jgi:glycosyltransferase involved in cell wall biosynthesis
MHYLYGMQYGQNKVRDEHNRAKIAKHQSFLKQNNLPAETPCPDLEHVGREGRDGHWYDCVIPNYFFPEDFPMGEHKGDEKGEYMLYMGRIIYRKGVDIAVATAKACGKRLIIAGQGSLKNPSEGLDIKGEHIEYIGAVGPEERAKLLGGAICSFCPTYYIEPFGGAAVEAQLAGTPVITTDWGAMTETTMHGVTGWRCRTMDDFVYAANQCSKMDHKKIRDYAVVNYSCHRISEMYQEFFDKVYDIQTVGGFYHVHPERTGLNWLKRYH